LGESVLGTKEGREQEAKVQFFGGEQISNAASASKRAANTIQAMNPPQFHAHAAAQRTNSARVSLAEPIISFWRE
jgi:hypothetical protein